MNDELTLTEAAELAGVSKAKILGMLRGGDITQSEASANQAEPRFHKSIFKAQVERWQQKSYSPVKASTMARLERLMLKVEKTFGARR